jgi:hypothetical protein
MLAPNVKIVWVTDTAYDPANPSIAILNGPKAFDISCAIVTGYTLNPKASDTVTTKSICDNANVKAPVRYNYEGKLVRRVGLPQATAFAVAQEVSSFLFMNDVPMDVVGTDEIQFTTAFLQQGNMQLYKPTVA